MPAAPTLGGRSLAVQLPPRSQLRAPVYLGLRDAIIALVLDGRVLAGTRLPSERELAASLALSRATVTAAYDALREEGYLDRRTGAGSFVRLPLSSRPRASINRWSTPDTDGAGVIDLSCAAMAAPAEVVPAALARAGEWLGPRLGDDGYDPAGLIELRAAVADRFAAGGVATAPEQILITNGASHAVDLILRLLLDPGERVLTELPSYPGALDAIRTNRGRLVPVPLVSPTHDGGWDVERMQATLRQAAPRLAYLIPDFHNPTGILVPEPERRAVLQAARRANTTVIVDESFVDLGFEPPAPRMAALDPSVLSVGSLSKSVWAGLRVGWIRGPAELIARLAAARAGIDMGGAVIDQLVALALFERLDEVAAARRAQLRPQRDALIAAIGRELPQWRVSSPAGGLSLWIELDAPLSTPLAMLAGPAGVIVVPGSRFGVDGTLERFLRLPYSQPAEQLERAVTRLAAVWSGLDRRVVGSAPLVVA